MNILEGTIKTIEVEDRISLTTIAVGDELLTAVLLETPDTVDYLSPGRPVQAIFKENEVVIARRDVREVSMRNQIGGEIHSIESGKLLSRVSINTSVGRLVSVITSRSCLSLKLRTGDRVIALIKTNEIMLSKP